MIILSRRAKPATEDQPMTAATALATAEALLADLAPRCAAAIQLRAKLTSKADARQMVTDRDLGLFAAWLYRSASDRAWRISSRVYRRRVYRADQRVAALDASLAAERSLEDAEPARAARAA